MSGPLQKFTQQEAATINRSIRLKYLMQQEGWADLVKISEAIVKQALDNMDAYPGIDEKQMAQLTFIWKTVKDHHAKLLATVQYQIEQGDALLLSNIPKVSEPEKRSETAMHFPLVKPVCDTYAAENAGGETEN